MDGNLIRIIVMHTYSGKFFCYTVNLSDLAFENKRKCLTHVLISRVIQKIHFTVLSILMNVSSEFLKTFSLYRTVFIQPPLIWKILIK